MQGYLEFVDGETRKRFEAGLRARDAAFDIDLGEYTDWADAERLGANVIALYREYGGGVGETDIAEVFGLMAELRKCAR